LGFLSKYECLVTDVIMPPYNDDENLPIINKSKHSKREKYKRTKWKDPSSRRQKKNHQRRQITKGTSSSRTSSCYEKSISNKSKERTS
jgi:hypothetical protein